MTVTALRLDAVALVDLDRELCELGPVRLVRCDGELFLECAAPLVERARGLLARAGARADVAETPRAPSGFVPGIVFDLEPLRAPEALDAVTVRPLDAGRATARCVRRRLWRDRVDAEAMRAILRGEPAFSWWRAVWMRRRVLRSAALRRVRPVVFDRSALAGSEDRFALAREALLTRWAG